MKKIFWITAPIVWVFSLIIMTIALTNKNTGNVLVQNRLVVGLGFIVISGIIREIYRRYINTPGQN
jgi:hypothetical protein